MAFTYDIDTNRGKVRFELADTAGESSGAVSTTGAYVFEDAEIDYLLTKGGSVAGAVREGLLVLLNDRARRVKHFTLKGVSLDDTAQVKALETALRLAGHLPRARVVFPKHLPMDEGFTEPST